MERWSAEVFRGTELKRPGRWGVAFLADWCPFCRAFRPRFEDLEGKVEASLALADVTPEDSPLWDSFSIEVVPTVALFEDGKLVWRRDGKPMVGLGPEDLEDLRRALVQRARRPSAPTR